LDGVHLAEDRLDDRLRRAKVARAFFVRSLRAMRCLGVAVFDTGPRGARGSAAFSATRAPASRSTYTHVFDQVGHNAEIRSSIGRSQFASALAAITSTAGGLRRREARPECWS
jgi:hypothetical protein